MYHLNALQVGNAGARVAVLVGRVIYGVRAETAHKVVSIRTGTETNHTYKSHARQDKGLGWGQGMLKGDRGNGEGREFRGERSGRRE